MINCKNCGAQIAEEAKFCPQCGTPAAESIQTAEIANEQTVNTQIPPNSINNNTYNTAGAQPNYTAQNLNAQNYNAVPNYTYQPYQIQKTNGMCIAGFIVSLVGMFSIPLISGIVGIILSIIGVKKVNISNEKGKGFGIAGIIVGAVNILVGIIIIILFVYYLNYMYYYLY